MLLPIDPEVMARVERIALPFNRFGYDPWGISKKHLGVMFTALRFFYRHYFRVKTFGIENVPRSGRVMLIGNHSGGVAVDGAMVIAAMLLELDPPRLAQGMAEKFINRLPMASLWSSRTGQFTGLPEHAEALLNDDRMLMVFPEGARGTAKLYWERHSLVEFGTGFMRLALATKTPIVPVGILGGGEAIPTVWNSKLLGNFIGAPYVPFTPYGLAVPLPAKIELRFGEPMVFDGVGSEDDDTIIPMVDRVKSRIAALMADGLLVREGALP